MSCVLAVNSAAIVRIVHDEIGIAAGLDCAFAGKEIKDLGGVGACDVDKGVEIESASSHAIGVEKIDSIL